MFRFIAPRHILSLVIYSLSGAVPVSADFFSEGVAPALVRSIQCVGNETMLLECRNVLEEERSCSRAGVSCQGISLLYALYHAYSTHTLFVWMIQLLTLPLATVLLESFVLVSTLTSH